MVQPIGSIYNYIFIIPNVTDVESLGSRHHKDDEMYEHRKQNKKIFRDPNS